MPTDRGSRDRTRSPFLLAGGGNRSAEEQRSLAQRLTDLTDIDDPRFVSPFKDPTICRIIREAWLPAGLKASVDELAIGTRGLDHRRRP